MASAEAIELKAKPEIHGVALAVLVVLWVAGLAGAFALPQVAGAASSLGAASPWPAVVAHGGLFGLVLFCISMGQGVTERAPLGFVMVASCALAGIAGAVESDLARNAPAYGMAIAAGGSAIVAMGGRSRAVVVGCLLAPLAFTLCMRALHGGAYGEPFVLAAHFVAGTVLSMLGVVACSMFFIGLYLILSLFSRSMRRWVKEHAPESAADAGGEALQPGEVNYFGKPILVEWSDGAWRVQGNPGEAWYDALVMLGARGEHTPATAHLYRVVMPGHVIPDEPK